MMKHVFLNDISDFIFISDPPENADIIFIPGGSYPELPELRFLHQHPSSLQGRKPLSAHHSG